MLQMILYACLFFRFDKANQSDEQYFKEIEDKEFAWLSKNANSFEEIDSGTWKCTACFKQINHKVLKQPIYDKIFCLKLEKEGSLYSSRAY